MKNEIIKTTLLVGVSLGAIIANDATNRQNTIEAIIGAALIMTGLLSMELERIIDRIEVTGALIAACITKPEVGKAVNRITKKIQKMEKEERDHD